jgi:hypothetical protein
MLNYVRIVEEGCDLLGEIKEGFIPEDKRDKIFAHRKEELLAHAAYTTARKRLWKFLSDSAPRLARMNEVPTKTNRASS